MPGYSRFDAPHQGGSYGKRTSCGPDRYPNVAGIKVSKMDQFSQGPTAKGPQPHSVAQRRTCAQLLHCWIIWAGRANMLALSFASKTGNPFKGVPSLPRFSRPSQAFGVNGSLFNGHSFHLGSATTGSIAGVSEFTVKFLGRWQSTPY